MPPRYPAGSEIEALRGSARLAGHFMHALSSVCHDFGKFWCPGEANPGLLIHRPSGSDEKASDQ